MRNIFLLFLLISTSGNLFAADESLQTFLTEFHQNPEKMLNQLPPEIKDGKVIDRGFINAEILDRQLLEEKAARREDVKKHSEYNERLFSVIVEGDDPRALIDNGTAVTNIHELNRRGLMRKALSEELWSDTYWPIYKGLLANRYAHGLNPQSKDWNVNYAYYMSVPTFMVSTDDLSPAEKYDLLVGDSNMSLTNYSWNSARQYVERYGSVPTWMGICHGWSAATHMKAKIPYGTVELKARDGRSIRFFQSDIKALQSMLWANASPPTRFLGYRCDGNPPRDNTGRVIDDKCRDTNPATFFLSLTNQLGMNNRSFVMDATFDSEVWNFSIVSYKGTFFNPQTFQQTDDLKKAVIPYNRFTIDKFRSVRAAGTAYVVGVTMDVTYMNENTPSHAVQTKPATKTNRYVYDLELDANYNVIGGEWYNRAHPDFLWTYSPEAQAVAKGDADIVATDWNVTQPVPSAWAAAAQKSSRSGQPLYSVIRRIMEVAPTREDYNRALVNGEVQPEPGL